MLRGPRTPARPGYTLLEVILASVIAVILLGALYVALDLMLNRMDAGRDQVSGNDLARAIVTTRMSADLAGTLGPLPPKSGGSPADQSAGGGSGSTPTSTGSQPTTTATPSASSPTTTTADPTTGQQSSPAATGVDVPFGAGIIGTDKQLIVFAGRAPDALIDPQAAASPDLLLGADFKKIVYYLGSDGGGLCRQVRPMVTADGVWNTTDPDLTTELTDVIAPEVKDVLFEYYDGGTWQSSWDGSETSDDGVTLLGPPRAVRVTLTLEFPGKGGAMTQKRVQQVFPIRAAVGNYTPPTDGTTGTTGGM